MQQPVQFGKYLLLERISVGGMAEVFKAKSFGVMGFAKIVAIKRILPQLAEDAHFVDMFVNEAKTAVQLTHANICQIFDLGRESNDHFIAMEYISGKDLLSLHNYFRRSRTRMPVGLVAYVAAKICEGLDYAHRKRGPDNEPLGIVHRDVSPQNVIVSYDGGVKVIDFGIAKARARNIQETQAGVLKGKFGYMSPEQIEGTREIDHRSDIFAIGTVVHELLTGKRLFLGDSDFATLEMVRNAEVPAASLTNSDVPPELDRILFRALTRSPDDRYAYASEMAEDLTALLHGMGQPISAQGLGEWMAENFKADIAKEKARHEQYANIDGPVATPDDSNELDQTRVDDPSARSEDEEEETALWQPLAEESPPPRKPSRPLPSISQRLPVGRAPADPQPTGRVVSLAGPSDAAADLALRRTMPPTGAPPRSTGPTKRDIVIAVLLVAFAALGGVLAYRALESGGPHGPTTGLVVRVEPPDEVTLYVDNQVVAGHSPFVQKDLTVGAHTLRVEHAGFEPWRGQVVLTANEVKEQQVRLEAVKVSPSRVLFVLDPPDATLTIDGRHISLTELASYLTLPGGRPVALEARRDGFTGHTETYKPESGGSHTHNITLVPTRGSLFVDSDPPGEVVVDGQRRGRTPQTIQDLDVIREYVVRVERPGYVTSEERVRFGEKRYVQVEPKLKPASR